MHSHVEMHRAGPDELTQSIMVLIAQAMRGGVSDGGESLTIMVPPGVEMSLTKDGPLDDIGEWEIIIKKVS